jgi:hypothetical protein
VRAVPDELLDKRSKSGWYKNWPGPIADYVLGRIDEDGLQNECARFKDNERGLLSARWEIGFYVGIVALSQGNSDRYKKLIQDASIIWDDDLDPAKRQYLSKLASSTEFMGEFWLGKLAKCVI